MEVCLVIVFNHRYDKNIPKLKSIYSSRFSNIYYLVPFYDGNEKNVIPVYESSYQFQGYFAQGFKNFFNERYDYYVFIGDDLILNPNLNEVNIIQALKLEKDSYIKHIKPINDSRGVDATRLFDMLLAFESKGTEYKREIPSYDEAMKLANDKGLVSNRLEIKFYKNMPKKNLLKPKVLFEFIVFMFKSKGGRLPYPLFKDYSDFIVLSKEDICGFTRLCGVFAAMGLFVEISIPTSMVLSCAKIVVEKDINLEGIELWSESEKSEIETCNGLDLNQLFDTWNENVLYYHPIKLSKWNWKEKN